MTSRAKVSIVPTSTEDSRIGRRARKLGVLQVGERSTGLFHLARWGVRLKRMMMRGGPERCGGRFGATGFFIEPEMGEIIKDARLFRVGAADLCL